MKYYINCEDKNEFEETLSMLNYYGFNLKLSEKFDPSCSFNLFVVDTNCYEATLTHSVKNKILASDLCDIYTFEDIILQEKHASI